MLELILLLIGIIAGISVIAYRYRHNPLFKPIIVALVGGSILAGGLIIYNNGGDTPFDEEVPEPYLYEHFIPPANSFGIGETNFTYVNWSFFWQMFNANSAWDLKAQAYTQDNISSFWSYFNQYSYERLYVKNAQEEWVDWTDNLNKVNYKTKLNYSASSDINFTSSSQGTTDYAYVFKITRESLGYYNIDNYTTHMNFTGENGGLVELDINYSSAFFNDYSEIMDNVTLDKGKDQNNYTYLRIIFNDVLPSTLVECDNIIDVLIRNLDYDTQWYSEYEGFDIDSWLNITRTRDESESFEKVSLNLTNGAPIDTEFKFTFGIDARVLQYVNKTDQMEYVLTYPINNSEYNYTVFFNWSDLIPMLDNGTIRVNHGIKQIGGRDVFWFNIITNVKLQSGKSYDLDPWFGHAASSTKYNMENIIGIGKFTSPDSGGIIDNLGAYIYSSTGAGTECKMMMWDMSGNVIAESDTKSIGSTTDGNVTFDMSEDYTILPNTDYYIGVWGDENAAGYFQYYYTSSGGQGQYADVVTYVSSDSSPPDPHTPTLQHAGYATAVWCSYTTVETFSYVDVYAGFQDGKINVPADASWSTVHDAVSGTNTSDGSSHPTAIMSQYNRGKYQIYRTFMPFHLSQLDTTNYTIDNAYLHVEGYASTSNDLIVVKSTQDTVLDDADFNNITWAVNYSGEITDWAVDDNNITLNSDFIADATANSSVYLAIIDFDYDFENTPPPGTDIKSGVYFRDNQAEQPYIRFILSEPEDATPPSITINFAGNTSDDGGPYYSDTGESISADDGYYTNDSYQSENFIYVNATVTDSEGSVNSVYLHMHNVTDGTWDNTTQMTQHGSYYDTTYTVSSTDDKFTFHINATDDSDNEQLVYWNKSGYDDTNTTRYVTLNCSSITDISSSILYLLRNTTYAPAYDSTEEGDYDVLHHDQGVGSGTQDTGYMSASNLTSNIENVRCSGYISFWIEDNACYGNTTLDNFYIHFWLSKNDEETSTIVGWNNSKECTNQGAANDEIVITYTDNVTHGITYTTGAEFSNNYALFAKYVEVTNEDFTDNSIYNLLINVRGGGLPSIICNESIQSWVWLNVPDNDTLDDWDNDSDGLNSWEELYVTYTNPFDNDTDDDGVSDFYENVTGSDPNDYTDHTDFVMDAPALTGATANNATQITITWTDDDEADTTYIEWDSVNDTSWNRGDHNNTSINSSSGSAAHTGLSPSTTYYYKAWSRNNTANEWSEGSNRIDATTNALTLHYTTCTFGGSGTVLVNSAPTLSNPASYTNTTGNSITTSEWNITITDDGAFDWSIETAPDIGDNSANDATTGSKTVSLSGLLFYTNYTIYVNVTDGENIVNATYWFETQKVYYSSHTFGGSTTVTESAEEYQTTIRSIGSDYFIWLGGNVSAYDVSTTIGATWGSGEYIAYWNESGNWDDSTWNRNGTWYEFHPHNTSGDNFTIHTFDVIHTYITDDSGDITFNMTENSEITYSAARTVTLTNTTDNKGGNYTGYTNSSSTTLTDIITAASLQTGEYIALWNETNYNWDFYIAGLFGKNAAVHQYDVIFTKVEDTRTWEIGGV